MIKWATPRGSLGTIPESQYYDFSFSASDTDELPISYSLISGTVPAGMYVTQDGKFRGSPTLLTNNDVSSNYAFTVRATNTRGAVADRSFSVTVSNITGPTIFLPADIVGAWFDGTYLEYQFQFISDNPNTSPTFKVTSGSLPPGTTLSPDGKLSGFLDIIAVNSSDLGFEALRSDVSLYDQLAKSTDRYYNFTVQCTDGLKFDTKNVTVLVVSKGNYTADNSVTLINNTLITVDFDNSYRPIILNAPNSLPAAVSGNNFAYRLLAYDPQDQAVSWTIGGADFSGLDQLDLGEQQMIVGNGTSGPYQLINDPITANKLVIRFNDILLTAGFDYTTTEDQLTFTSLAPIASDTVEVLYVTDYSGYDTSLFDQGDSGLPVGLSINPTTGWIFGKLPEQTEETKTYTFRATAFRTFTPENRSDVVTFSLTVQRAINEQITWDTPNDLGVIDNGAVSELAISARNTLGKELEYSLEYSDYTKVPQGLKLLPSGLLVGRTTFRYFSLDGASAKINLLSTTDLRVGMQIFGAGVPEGCRITNISSPTQVEVRPAIAVEQGTILTFIDTLGSKTLSITSNSISTAIDGGRTTFDQVSRFTVKATSLDGSSSDTRTFSVRVRPYNLAPYENLYLKPLMMPEQRQKIRSAILDSTVLPRSILYRPEDPYFGVQKTPRMLFMAGLATTTADRLIESVQQNHYNKRINFGDIKTAVAKDEFGNIIYEVIYVEAVDSQTYGTSGPPQSVNLDIANKFLYGDNQYSTLYPNSFENMTSRVGGIVGFSNRGAIPRWMLTVQENGLVLGLIRSMVIAYTKPNESKRAAFHLKNRLNNTTADFSFVADRYQWDNYLSEFYVQNQSTFEPSISMTFDKYVNPIGVGDVLTTTVEQTVVNSTVITLPPNINVGIGWRINAVDIGTTIPNNTKVTAVSGVHITLSNPVSIQAGAAIRVNGEARVDYAVSTPFSLINNQLLSEIDRQKYIDGISSVLENELIVFKDQMGDPNLVNNGWMNGDVPVPGYLDKIGGASPVNEQGGVWRITWDKTSTIGFDSDTVGFDGAEDGITHSYFDQQEDNEVKMVFESEVILNQRVYVRSGFTNSSSVLTYTLIDGLVTPQYESDNGRVDSIETTFDGKACSFKERNSTPAVANRDKYVRPETKDKYIKFPQNGVFV